MLPVSIPSSKPPISNTRGYKMMSSSKSALGSNKSFNVLRDNHTSLSPTNLLQMGLNGFYNGTFDQDSLPKHVFT